MFNFAVVQLKNSQKIDVVQLAVVHFGLKKELSSRYTPPVIRVSIELQLIDWFLVQCLKMFVFRKSGPS